jgi:uncharacterized protein YcaQ
MSTGKKIYELSAARALALYAQRLIDPGIEQDERQTSESIYRVVRDLGCVQIDTLNVVHRSHYLTIWSRLGDYNLIDFDHLIYNPGERRLFEGWQHATSIIPLEDYRYQIPHMHYLRCNPAKMSVEWLATPESKEMLRLVKKRIEEEGPLRAADFKYKGPKKDSWWDWKPAKNALEHLFAWGELMISDRVNFQRVYDLRRRVLPEWVDISEPTLAERDLYWLERGVRALGICQPLQAADYSYRKRSVVKGYIEEMIAKGRLIEVKVRLLDGKVKPYVVHSQDRQLLDQAAEGDIVPRRTTFLSPFDNLFWARGRCDQFWNFRNVLEAYKPEAKRIWGYFCLPILHRARLVGRVNPRMDRKNARLLLKSIYLEEGIEPEDDLVASIAQALRSFMNFHQAVDFEIVRSQPSDLRHRIVAHM